MTFARIIILSLLFCAGFYSPNASGQLLPSPTQTLLDKTAAKYESLLAAPPRTISSSSSEKALGLMGLDDSNNSPLSWSQKTGGYGNYTLLNIRGEDFGGSAMTIDRLNIFGLRMKDTEATFDRIDILGFNAEAPGGKLAFGQLSISDPAPEFASAIIQLFKNFDDGDPLEAYFEGKNIDCAATVFLRESLFEFGEGEDVGKISMALLGWSIDNTNNTGQLAARDIKMTSTENSDDVPIDLRLEAMDATGVRLDYLKTMFEGYSEPDSFSAIFSQNPYDQQFDQMSMSGLSLIIDTLVVGLESYHTKSHKSGDILKIITSMQPLTFGFSGPPSDDELTEIYAGMTEAGLNPVSMTAGGVSTFNEAKDSFGVSEAFWDIKDFMRFDTSYSGTGLKHIFNFAKNLDGKDSEIKDDVLKNLDEISDQIALTHFDLSFTDTSAINLALKIAAEEEEGSTPALLRIKAVAVLLAAPALVNTEAQADAAIEMAAAAKGLLEKGGTFEIKMRPENPINIKTFEGVELENLDPKILGLSFSHKSR